MEKQFYHLGRKTKEYPRTCKADRQPHSHNTHTRIRTSSHTQDTKHHKARTPRNMRQVQTHPFVTIKLHTVHHTTEDLSQWMAFTREERNHFKEHLLWSSSRALADILRWEEAAPEKTLISWFLFKCYRKKLFNPGSMVVENCPSRQRGEPLLFLYLNGETLSQQWVRSRDCSFSRRRDGKAWWKENT